LLVEGWVRVRSNLLCGFISWALGSSPREKLRVGDDAGRKLGWGEVLNNADSVKVRI
jgi:hypothetical protein